MVATLREPGPRQCAAIENVRNGLIKNAFKSNRSFFSYQLVQNCWKEEPSERPTFESATRSLEEMMQEDTPYLDFESLDESKAYYCIEKLSDDDSQTSFCNKSA